MLQQKYLQCNFSLNIMLCWKLNHDNFPFSIYKGLFYLLRGNALNVSWKRGYFQLTINLHKYHKCYWFDIKMYLINS